MFKKDRQVFTGKYFQNAQNGLLILTIFGSAPEI